MHLRYTREALRDLDEISSYIAERNVAAAAAFLNAVATVAQRLAQFPLSAAETEMTGVRAAQVLRFPYIIFYTVEDGDDVVVHYVRHAARLRPWEVEE
jgi:addiction module RelE/StbE family toxin